jgi:hypothetical protein
MVDFRLAVTVMALLVGGCGDPCGNEISQTVKSPSGKLDAVVFNRNCGATTGFNTQVSVIPAGTNLPAEGGNVFITNGAPPIQVNWQSETKLHIGGVSGVEAVKKEGKILGVEIMYAL